MPKEALEVQMSTEDICAMLEFTKEFEWKCLIVKTCLNFGKSIKLACHEKQFLKHLLVFVAKWIG